MAWKKKSQTNKNLISTHNIIDWERHTVAGMHISLIYYANDANTESNGIRKYRTRKRNKSQNSSNASHLFIVEPQLNSANATICWVVRTLHFYIGIQCMWIINVCVYLSIDWNFVEYSIGSIRWFFVAALFTFLYLILFSLLICYRWHASYI